MISSAIWNLTTTYILSKKTIKIDVKILCTGTALGTSWTGTLSLFILILGKMPICLVVSLVYCCLGCPMQAHRQQQEVIADSDSRGKN